MSVAFILHSLLDLHSHPAQTVDDPETSIYRIDLLTAVEKAYKEGSIDWFQLVLLDKFLQGYSLSYLSICYRGNLKEELTSALKAIAAISIDYEDNVFIQKYKDTYHVTEEYLRDKLENLGSDFTVIKELNNELEYNTT